tara:strand:+ start:354 stop:1175 length:822 start_codon:yes stop_codon:yes gene_type:complete
MPVNYLNNKDILKQIHKSKNSYCSFVREDYDKYDIIVPTLDKINIRTIAQAKRNRANKMQKEAYEVAKLTNKKVKQAEFEVKWQKISKTDLIFRVMTYDHIPLEPGRKRKPKTEADHRVKVNFPPFQHYKFDASDKIKCVGKSHWVGSMSNGKFVEPLNHPQGKMTNELARMFLKLCKRYATRANWRGYTANDEMQSQALLQLSQIGLQFDESKSDNPFAYYTAAITNSFTRILNIEKKNQNIRDDLLELAQMKPSSTRQNQDLTSTPYTPKK